MQAQRATCYGALLPALVSFLSLRCLGQDGTVTFTVKVVDDVRNVGIKDAGVQAKDDHGHEVSNVTDGSGVFTTQGLSRGKVTVTVKKVRYTKYPTTKETTFSDARSSLEIRLLNENGDDKYYDEAARAVAQDLKGSKPDYSRWKMIEESPGIAPARKIRVAAEVAKDTPPAKLQDSTIPAYAQLAPSDLEKAQRLFEAAIRGEGPVPSRDKVNPQFIPDSAIISIAAVCIAVAPDTRKKPFLNDFEKEWGTDAASKVRQHAVTYEVTRPHQ